jgi:hypothetical protein
MSFLLSGQRYMKEGDAYVIEGAAPSLIPTPPVSTTPERGAYAAAPETNATASSESGSQAASPETIPLAS